MTDGPRFLMRGYWIALAILVAPTVVPLAILEATNWYAHLHGCQLHFKLGSVCMIDGADWGPQLNGTVAWSMIIGGIAFYGSAIGLVVWLIVLLANLFQWRRHVASARASDRQRKGLP